MVPHYRTPLHATSNKIKCDHFLEGVAMFCRSNHTQCTHDDDIYHITLCGHFMAIFTRVNMIQCLIIILIIVIIIMADGSVPSTTGIVELQIHVRAAFCGKRTVDFNSSHTRGCHRPVAFRRFTTSNQCSSSSPLLSEARMMWPSISLLPRRFSLIT